MAIKVINSQGMKMYVVAPSLGITAPTVALIQAGSLVGCPQSVGALEQTRSVKEYGCMSSDETVKVLGSIKRGNIQIGLLFDPTDTLGQSKLKAAFAANSEVTIGIELPNNAGVSGTIFAFNAVISGVSLGIVMDEGITYDVTAEISSTITELPASAV